MSLCRFSLSQDGRYCECQDCHRRVKKSHHSCDNHHAACKVHTPRPANGLGDRIESYLTTIGITNHRIKAWKKRMGLKPTCGCQWRKEVLNRLDRRVRRWFT